jgi:branched-chain amino acid transport system substrate-binding protein
MSGAALAPVLKNAYGTDRKAYHLTADYNWGYTTEEAVRASTEAMGWETVNNVLTPLTQTDFSSYIAPVLQSGADVLVLNHYGGNMVNSLTNAVQFGLRDKHGQRQAVRDRRSALLAPDGEGCRCQREGHLRLDELALVAAGRSEVGSKAFVKSFGTKYGFPPSQAAHTCYVQTLLYADAVSAPARSTPAPLSKPSKASSSTAGQRPDALSRRRPPVLQGRAGREGEREPDLRVRPSRNRRSHPGRAGHLRAGSPAVRGGDLGTCNPGA